ncbi:hypothetical protein EZJ49_12545 [Bdellovibrio bacteriovorus]|uniref:hypothetical protein n=1 Tax=Bdellovibrio bacteriovorus TaxID=959 RepID=UPI0021D2C4DA|nr:hypothetical protein [Bdellovibrio bacteriovorus]UXR63893.1 hypothetical protein EZJ49_12545 [Bdellovibrio bacteriovorus]
MKALLMALTASFAMASITHAQDCVSADGLIIPDGLTVKLYYSANPTKSLGPAYTCDSVARVRTCVAGVLSAKEIQCSEYDSGGCVDWWMDRLPDTDFATVQCHN